MRLSRCQSFCMVSITFSIVIMHRRDICLTPAACRESSEDYSACTPCIRSKLLRHDERFGRTDLLYRHCPIMPDGRAIPSRRSQHGPPDRHHWQAIPTWNRVLLFISSSHSSFYGHTCAAPLVRLTVSITCESRWSFMVAGTALGVVGLV